MSGISTFSAYFLVRFASYVIILSMDKCECGSLTRIDIRERSCTNFVKVSSDTNRGFRTSFTMDVMEVRFSFTNNEGDPTSGYRMIVV